MASSSRLLPVAATGELHHPALRRDERGIVVGRECLLRFPGLSELVAFLRLQALRGDLQGILPRLEALALLGDGSGSDFALRLAVQSSREVEAFVETARLAGGQVFVGDGRTFVPFRDAEAPFGHDLLEAAEPSRGLKLHRPAGSLSYPELRRIDLAELVYSLPLVRSFGSAAERPLVLQVPPGLYRAVSDCLLRHAQGSEVALVETNEPEAPRRFYLFRVRRLGPIGLRLLSEVPGLVLLVPVLETLLLPLGWRHPLPLEAMSSLAPTDALLVLRSGGGAPLRLPASGFHPHLPPVVLGPARRPVATRLLEEPLQRFGLSVLLVPSGRKEEAGGLLIPAAQHELLRRIVQSLPSMLLDGCTLAPGADVSVLLGPAEALRHLPLGTLLKARTERLYLPVGTSLVPDPPPEALARMFVGPADGDYVVLTSTDAYHFPPRSLLPLSRLLVARFYSRRVQLLSPSAEPGAELEFAQTLSQRVGRRLLRSADPEPAED